VAMKNPLVVIVLSLLSSTRKFHMSRARPKHSIHKITIFVVAALLIKSKQQHGKNQNRNTGLFIRSLKIFLGLFIYSFVVNGLMSN
jgi:hypothetical protein